MGDPALLACPCWVWMQEGRAEPRVVIDQLGPTSGEREIPLGSWLSPAGPLLSPEHLRPQSLGFILATVRRRQSHSMASTGGQLPPPPHS